MSKIMTCRRPGQEEKKEDDRKHTCMMTNNKGYMNSDMCITIPHDVCIHSQIHPPGRVPESSPLCQERDLTESESPKAPIPRSQDCTTVVDSLVGTPKFRKKMSLKNFCRNQ
eukprot:GHVS01062430.1.p1 GENE.GHVS01062430.1~~GHVS01062430.1.p1  ORF type:complete len:112 (-),score=10.55 GHVS01062430.1:1561-1896(-)